MNQPLFNKWINQINAFFLKYIRGILITWIILALFMFTDKVIKIFIEEIVSLSGFFITTLIMFAVIIGSSWIATELIKETQFYAPFRSHHIQKNLFWIVPLIYLLLAIILNVIYSNFDQNTLDKLLSMPILGNIVSFFS